MSCPATAPAEANVADAMRGLKVSPGSIYRHFPSEGGSSGSGHAGVAASHPRLVQTCRALVSEFRFVEAEHVVDLTAQVQHIIASVIKRGESHVANPAVGAAAALPCITQFRHHLLASEWHLLDIHEQLPPPLRSSSPASRTPFHPQLHDQTSSRLRTLIVKVGPSETAARIAPLMLVHSGSSIARDRPLIASLEAGFPGSVSRCSFWDTPPSGVLAAANDVISTRFG
ncbi:hypothetical protein [Micromonospora sp. ATA51]|uniref:hypothetical protein n=1 Tax=Micromonospora sp. ATA51 TaxID=2806098 RepID=UPI0035CA284E